MKWITRAHVHVDRVACPWLISRFIDSDAEFMFVAPTLVKKVAEVKNAIPFDAEGVELGHKDGHCSFVTIIEKYSL
ncbi:MAG: chromate resistance protein, partial [Caldiserica bacterium CG23_combo_of_CG06-09_8_20_14_all_35_60]